MPESIKVIDEGDGTIGYAFFINKQYAWITEDEGSKSYGYMYVRTDLTKDLVQCITYGNRYETAGAASATYTLFDSATFTDVGDIKEGKICTD